MPLYSVRTPTLGALAEYARTGSVTALIVWSIWLPRAARRSLAPAAAAAARSAVRDALGLQDEAGGAATDFRDFAMTAAERLAHHYRLAPSETADMPLDLVAYLLAAGARREALEIHHRAALAGAKVGSPPKIPSYAGWRDGEHRRRASAAAIDALAEETARKLDELRAARAD